MRGPGEVGHLIFKFERRRALAALIGATAAFLFALLLELTGHPPWYFLLMLLAALAPSLILTVKRSARIEAFRHACQNQPIWLRFGAILLMIALALGAKWAFDAGPRDSGYMLLLIPVIISAALFGFGPALITVAASTAAADYYFAVPAFSFWLTEWEDAVALAAFAIIGALAALALDETLNLDDP